MFAFWWRNHFYSPRNTQRTIIKSTRWRLPHLFITEKKTKKRSRHKNKEGAIGSSGYGDVRITLGTDWRDSTVYVNVKGFFVKEMAAVFWSHRALMLVMPRMPSFPGFPQLSWYIRCEYLPYHDQILRFEIWSVRVPGGPHEMIFSCFLKIRHLTPSESFYL